MILRSGEVLERRAPARRWDDAEIGLHSAVEHDAALRLSRREDLDHVGRRAEGLVDRRRVLLARRDEDVEIADRLGAAAQAARGLACEDAGHRLHACDERLGRHERLGHRAPLRSGRALLPRGDRNDELLLLLLSEARQIAELACLRRLLERVDGGDASLLPDLLRRLQADARDVHQVEQAGRKLRTQLLGLRDLPGLEQLLDPARDAAADPTHRLELACAHEVRDARRGALDRARGVAERANGEGALTRQLEKIGEV